MDRDDGAPRESSPRARTGGRPAAVLLWLVPALLAGASLRLAGLPGQVLIGDEIHGLRAAVDLPVHQIFQFRGADHCIPFTALFRGLAALGLRLDETLLRSPSVVAGLGTLVLLPLAAARWRGARLGVLYGWLLAVTPVFVYYSRIARPYMLSVLLAAGAAAAFWHWYRGGRHLWAAVYVVAGGLALWLHLGFAPFLGAAPVFAVFDRLVRYRRTREGAIRPPERSLGALVVTGCAMAGAVLLIVLPVFRSFRRVFLNKQGGAETSLECVADVLRLQAGSAHAVVAVLFWLTALAGLAVLLRRRPRFALYGLSLVAAQWLAIAVVVEPFGVAVSHILGRYVLVVLPVVLLWAASALEAAWSALARAGAAGRRLGFLVPTAAVVALAAAGPYAADPWLRLGPFAGTNAAVAFHEPAPALPPELVPAVYRLIADAPGEGPLIEAVATHVSAHLDATVALARHHRRPVILAIDMPWLDDPRVGLRTITSLRPAGVCGSASRFVLLHRNRVHLERSTDAWAEGKPLPPFVRRDPSSPTRALAAGLLDVCGEPFVQAEDYWLWDLGRVRVLSNAGSPAAGER